jgi:hypothetical protein
MFTTTEEGKPVPRVEIENDLVGLRKTIYEELVQERYCFSDCQGARPSDYYDVFEFFYRFARPSPNKLFADLISHIANNNPWMFSEKLPHPIFIGLHWYAKELVQRSAFLKAYLEWLGKGDVLGDQQVVYWFLVASNYLERRVEESDEELQKRIESDWTQIKRLVAEIITDKKSRQVMPMYEQHPVVLHIQQYDKDFPSSF